MHPGQSLFTGVKVIDYRNARYQGLFNSQTGRRQGLGILIDDDMNLYCAEWEDGKMAGSTFIFLNNGNYMYGTFRSNEPNGLAVYRNREFLLLGNYHRGTNVGSNLAITDSINHLLVFNGEEVLNKEKKKDADIVSSQSILEIGLFEDIIAHTAAKHNLQLSKKDASLLEFLKALVEKYSQYIQLTQRAGIYYFGFQGGAAMRFTLNGRVNHRMSLVSMGWHDDDRITDFGAKFHDIRCIEQGNFALKETITYNKLSQRPRQKCHSIFQKNHKKALNFLNEYFEYRPPFLANIEWFLMSRLLPKHQENLKLEYDMRRLQRLQGMDGKDAHKESREELNKKANISKNARKGTESRTPNKSLSKNCSKAELHKKELTGYSPIPYKKYNERNQESLEVDEYHQIQEQLLNFKKQPICERCRSKQKKRSQNKVNNNPRLKKSFEKNNSKSKSTQKLDRPNGTKQIKYLVNYHPPQRDRSPMPLQKSNNSKSISNMVRAPLEDKQKIRMENQLKIRQQIYQQEIERQARHLQGINYPLTFSEFLAPLAKHQESLNINSFSPSSRQMKFSKAYPHKYQYEYPDSMGRNNQNLGVLASVSSIKKIEDLENRRDRILREFKELNTAAPASYTAYEKQHVNPYIRNSPSLRPNPVVEAPYSKQKDALSRQRVQDFNRRYRNYLQTSQKSNPSPIRSHFQDSAMAQPYVASFIHSPPTRPTPAQQKDRKKYEYFFQK